MDTNTPNLKTLSLTLVQYVPGDKLGHLMAYITLTPLAVLVSYASIILSRREVAVLMMLLGQLACEALNFGLKNIFQQPRPTDFLGKGYGMPSSHSQFVGFTSIYAMLYIWRRLNFKKTTNLFLSLVLISWCGSVGFSRVYLLYHTNSQVLVGLSLGGLFGSLWYVLAERFLSTPSCKALLDSDLARFLCIRDSRHIPNIWKYEHENNLNFSKKKTKKSD